VRWRTDERIDFADCCVCERGMLSPLEHHSHRSNIMLHYTIVFLVIAIIAGILGFGGIAGSAVGIAKILFLIFLVLFIASFIMGKRSRI